jgi:hypothetical protein
VRVGSSASNDTCDVVAPSAAADLSGCYWAYGPNAGKIDLAWSAPADDGTLAASGRAKLYDVRYSFGPISTETQRNLSTTLRHSLREFTEQPACTAPRT